HRLRQRLGRPLSVRLRALLRLCPIGARPTAGADHAQGLRPRLLLPPRTHGVTEPMTDPTPTTAQAGEALSPEGFAELATGIEREVGTFIVGQAQLVRQTLISLLAGS